MTIASHLALIKATLDAWAQTNGGAVQLCGSAGNVLQLLLSGPTKLRVYCQFESGDPYDDSADSTGMYRRAFKLVLSRGHGLAVDPSSNLMTAAPGSVPLYDLVEEAIALVRAIDFAPDEGNSMNRQKWAQELRSGSWSGADGLPIDAFEITWWIAVQLPAPPAVDQTQTGWNITLTRTNVIETTVAEPEGVVSRPPNSLLMQRTGQQLSLWYKESGAGATGWVEILRNQIV